MKMRKLETSSFKILLILATIVLLNGCDDIVLMHPKGKIGLEERSLILAALGLMLIVVVPAIVMTFLFAIKYRESNVVAKYRPNWADSNRLEKCFWMLPILIISVLSVLTWKSSHTLDPSKPILSSSEPIIIEVVALDWKWLFIYPERGIATINEIAFPSNVPVKFHITSNSVMNSFFIPQLGGQIYAMAGMKATLHLIANEPGKYKGMSSNFSGRGFSGMKFTVIATSDQDEFEQWIQKVKKSKKQMESMADYEKLAQPSEFHPVEYFSCVESGLFHKIIDKCMVDRKPNDSESEQDSTTKCILNHAMQ